MTLPTKWMAAVSLPLLLQIDYSASLSNKEEVRKNIRYHPINFFRHGQIIDYAVRLPHELPLIPSFLATKAQATVELTSPTTTTTSGRSFRQTSSKAIII